MDKSTKNRTKNEQKAEFETQGITEIILHGSFQTKNCRRSSQGQTNPAAGADDLRHTWQRHNFVLIRQSQGLLGYEKKPVQPANFAEVKKDIQHKKLEEENKELKELLRVAELRADLWQHAIETAEKKFDIEILKKYGARPSTAFISKGQKKK